MRKTIKFMKFAAICFVVFVFSFSLVILPAVRELNAASNGIVVFIDPGHGGRDPGAVANGLNEKDANIAIAARLKGKLEASGFTVVMRRSGDQYHTLDEIVNMANSSGADIFISIHNNASVSASANGTETYWCANGVNGSSQLASLVQSRLLSQIGRVNRGVKTADFRVIKNTRMPAALVECAFVSNLTEAALLKTADFQEKCATGLFNAINEFSKGINKDTGAYIGGSGNGSAGFTVIIDYPGNNASIDKNFLISGWAADLNNKPPKKLARVEIFKGLERTATNFLGTASRFDRPDLGRADILDSGYLLYISLDSLVKGENILYAYAYDVNGNYSYNMVKINVIKEVVPVGQPNSNPTANPGGPYKGTVNKAITFNGSASADTDGSITEYLWDFGDGSSGSGANPVHTYITAGTYTVKLTVKDDRDAQSSTIQTNAIISGEDGESGEEGDHGEPSGGEGVVSNSTSLIGYKPVTVEQLVSVFVNRNSNKLTKARILAILYIKIGSLFNLRADIAYAQMCHETGFLEYTGDVKPEQNNFCGLGAVGGGVPGNSFTSEKMGVIAHYAHLSWYYYQNHKNSYCSSQYDPRHLENTHSSYTGDTTLGFLNGRWAPGSTYTNKIILYANEIWQGTGETGSTVPVNAIPTASPGGPYTATAGTEITFDGSASADSDGSITEYNWNFGDNLTGTGAKPAHTYAAAGTYTVTLTVKDNSGASSNAKTSTVTVGAASGGTSYPVNTTPISNSTSIIGYTEVTVDQLVKIFTDRGSSKADWARRIAPIYINYGKLFNIRADIAYAQMCHETGFLEYTGDVKPNQNNFCGMGATGGGVPGNSFATEELGIIAHYAHLSWYYYQNHINDYCNSQYDPRHFGSSHYKYTGNTTLGFLNGNWAPGSTYTAKIILFANGIYGF